MGSITETYDHVIAQIDRLLAPGGHLAIEPDTALALDRAQFMLKSWKLETDHGAKPEHEPEPNEDQVIRMTRCLHNIAVDLENIDSRSSHSQESHSDMVSRLETEISRLNDIESEMHPIVVASLERDEWLSSADEDNGSERQSDFDLSWRPNEHEDLHVMGLLLESNRTDVESEILRAAALGHCRTMEELLSRSDWDNIRQMTDRHGRTALHVAVLHGHVEIVQMLLQKMPIIANPSLPQPAARTRESRLIRGADFTSEKDMEGFTPLHLAAQTGDIASVRLLLEFGADVEAANDRGFTPADLARKGGFVQIVSLVAYWDTSPGSGLDGGTRYFYHYKRLASSASIRLLKLRPSQTKSSAPLWCDLIETDPYESSYECLSYAWGDPSLQESIAIFDGDGESALSVSRELYDALLTLRDAQKPRLLWIDAVCINQQDLEEKSDQVRRMVSIYENAERVIAWLGNADQESGDAMSLIRSGGGLHGSSSFWNDIERWLALSKLIMRPWFSRVWVFQEIAFSRSRIVYCGHDFVLWADLVSVVEELIEFILSDVESQIEAQGRKLISSEDINMLQQVSHAGAARLVKTMKTMMHGSPQHAPISQADIEDWVLNFSYLEYSDPRDRIFALSAVAFSGNISPRRMPRNLATSAAGTGDWRNTSTWDHFLPHYGVPEATLYQSFVMHSIRESRNLGILCRPFAPAESSNALPSWVPDFTKASHRMLELDHGTAIARSRINGDCLASLPSIDKRSYNATGARDLDLRKTWFRPHEDSSSLFVEGFVFDTVAEVFTPAKDGYIPLNDWIDAVGLRRSGTGSDAESKTAFCRTLIADSFIGGEGSLSQQHGNLIDEVTSGDLVLSGSEQLSKASLMAKFRERVQEITWNRRLIRTSSGRLGLVSEQTKVGDIVGVLYGCSVPMILRRHSRSQTEIHITREQEAAELEGRLSRATELLEQFIQKRRKQGYAWPKQRRPLRFRLVKDDIWLTNIVVVLTTIVTLVRSKIRYHSLEILVVLCVVWMSLYVLAREISRMLTITQRMAGVAKMDKQLPLLLRELKAALAKIDRELLLLVTQLKAALAKVDRELLILVAPLIWCPLGYFFRDVNSGLESGLILGLLAATILQVRLQYRRIWQARPFEPKQCSYLLDANDSRNWYSVVGESYIHGIMDGEAIAWQARNNIRAEAFELR